MTVSTVCQLVCWKVRQYVSLTQLVQDIAGKYLTSNLVHLFTLMFRCSLLLGRLVVQGQGHFQTIWTLLMPGGSVFHKDILLFMNRKL